MLSSPLHRMVSLYLNTSFASFKQYKGKKNGDISLLQIGKPQSPHHPPHRDNLHPKKIYQNHSHGEDLSYHQFCRWFESAARMIIGNFEKSHVYFKAVSAIVPK